MSEQRGGGRSLAEREVDMFSISVLRYDRKNPRPEQRSPGEILEEVEERIDSAKARSNAMKKWLGALLLSVTTAVLLAIITAVWPLFMKLLGH